VQVGLSLSAARIAAGEADRLIHLDASGRVTTWSRGQADSWTAEENEA
jgi:hypothetical protein